MPGAKHKQYLLYVKTHLQFISFLTIYKVLVYVKELTSYEAMNFMSSFCLIFSSVLGGIFFLNHPYRIRGIFGEHKVWQNG